MVDYFMFFLLLSTLIWDTFLMDFILTIRIKRVKIPLSLSEFDFWLFGDWTLDLDLDYSLLIRYCINTDTGVFRLYAI